VSNLYKARVSFGFGSYDYITVGKQKIVLKTYIYILSCMKEFISVQRYGGDMGIYLTIEKQNFVLNPNYLFFFRCERIYKRSKGGTAWKFI